VLIYCAETRIAQIIEFQRGLRMKVLVIIPAYNEAENIPSVIDDLKANFGIADVLVVDDCSKDNTAEIVDSLNVRCVSQVFNMGYAAALQTGFKYAMKHGYDYAVQFDGDGQHIASEANKLFQYAIQNNSDVVLGSRFIEDTGYKNSLFRSIGSTFFSKLIKLICKKDIYDPTSGLQVLSRKCFSLYANMNGYPEYPDANLIIELIRSGASIAELPAKMKLRISGTSMHGGILKPIKYVFLMLYSIFIVLLRGKAFKK